MKIDRAIITGASLAKLKNGNSFELSFKVPSWAAERKPQRTRRGDRWFWLGDNPETNSFMDLWPHDGMRPPVRSGRKLYCPAGKVTVEECQALIHGGYEITYSYADGTWAKAVFSRTQRKPGKEYTFSGSRMARLTLSVVSVEPVQHGKSHAWHVIYRVENINEQTS